VLEYDIPLATDTVADRVFGQGGSFTSSTCNLGGISAGSLCEPHGVALDAAANLYIADGDNHRVLEYNTPLTTDTVADRVFGQGGSFTSGSCNSGGIGAGSLCFPIDVDTDGAGNLYVADGHTGRVFRFRAPPAPVFAALPAFTNQSPLTVGGTADPGARIDLFVNDAATPVGAAKPPNVPSASASGRRSPWRSASQRSSAPSGASRSARVSAWPFPR